MFEAPGEIQERITRLEQLLQELESIPNQDARSTALSAVQSLLEVYGEGIARCLELAGPEMARVFAEDELIAHLLLVHGLHPVPVESRVRAALESVRPYLQSHGGNVDLLRIDGGVAFLRLQGTCTGCSSSETTLKSLIERAIQEAAPDLDGIETEGGATATAGSFVALECLVPAAAGTTP